MSLTVSSSPSTFIAPIEEGSHLGVCSMLIDLGMQYSEMYKNSSRKVLIAWEIPDETIELEDGPHPRTISKRYTASLNESSNLRQDLAAWRGRDFTGEELEAFNLRNIVGKSCLINVIHKESGNKVYANIQSIMALPKGMKAGQLSEPPVIYDIDADPVEAVNNLPTWIKDLVTKSQSYQEKLAAPPKLTVIEKEDDGELPF